MKTYVKKEVIINKEEVSRNIVTSQLDLCEKLNSKLEELQKKYNSLYLELETLNKKEKSIKKDFVEINKVKTMLNISLIKIEEKEKHDRNIEPIIDQYKQTINESKRNIAKRCKDIAAKEKDLLVKEFLIHYITTNKAKLRKEIYGKNRSLETNTSISVSNNQSKNKRTISTTISAKINAKPINNKPNNKNIKIDSEIINESINNETIKKKIEFGNLNNNDSISLKKSAKIENKSINKDLDNSKISADMNKSKIIENIKFSDRSEDIIIMKNNEKNKVTSKPKKSKHKPLNERILLRNQSMIISHVNSITLYKIIYKKLDILNTTNKSIEDSFKIDNRIDSENNIIKRKSDTKNFQIIENNSKELVEQRFKDSTKNTINSSYLNANSTIENKNKPNFINEFAESEDNQLSSNKENKNNTKNIIKQEQLIENKSINDNIQPNLKEKEKDLKEEKRLDEIRKKSATLIVDNILKKASLNVNLESEINSSDKQGDINVKPPKIDFKQIPINLKFEKVLDDVTVKKIKDMISGILDKISKVTNENILINKYEDKERRSVLKQNNEIKTKKSLTITFDESKNDKNEKVEKVEKVEKDISYTDKNKNKTSDELVKNEGSINDKSKLNMRRVSNSKSCKALHNILSQSDLNDDDVDDENKNNIEEFETVTKRIKVKRTVKKIVKKKSVEDKSYKTVVSSILLNSNKDDNFEKFKLLDSSEDEDSPKKNIKKGTVCYTKSEINDFNFDEKFNNITKKHQADINKQNDEINKAKKNAMSDQQINISSDIKINDNTTNKVKANELLLKEKDRTIHELNESAHIDSSIQKDNNRNVGNLSSNQFEYDAKQFPIKSDSNTKIVNNNIPVENLSSNVQVEDIKKDKDASRENVQAELYVSSEESEDKEDYEQIGEKLKKMVEESNALDKNVRIVSDNISNMISSNHNSIHNSINV